MPSALSVYLIEEKSLENGPLSCLTGKLKGSSLLKEPPMYFSSVKEFERCLHETMGAMKKDSDDNPNDTYLLILSAHGMAQTGTLLKANSDEAINLRFHADFFEILPPKLVVYISACWGLYPSIIEALTSSKTHKPTLIGPLIPIKEAHNKELQIKMIDILLKHQGSDTYEAALCCIVKSLNDNWQDEFDQESVGVVLRDGTWIPSRGRGGISAPLRIKQHRSEEIKDIAYRIVAFQKYDCRNDREPLNAVLWDGEFFWRISSPIPPCILKKLDDTSSYAYIGEFIEITTKVIHEPFPETGIGQLEVIGKPRFIEGTNKLKKYRIPNSNASEYPDKNKAVAPKKILVSSIERACKACNWATLRWWQERDKKEGKMIRGVEGRCFREDCIEHER